MYCPDKFYKPYDKIMASLKGIRLIHENQKKSVTKLSILIKLQRNDISCQCGVGKRMHPCPKIRLTTVLLPQHCS